MTRYRGRARFVSPPREMIRQTIGGRLPRHLTDGKVACLLDYVLGKYKDIENKDPASEAVYQAVRAEAWDGLLHLLEAHAVLKALGHTDKGDTQLLVFMLCNLTKKTGKWQDIRRMVISGQITEHKILTVEIVDSGNGERPFKERVPIQTPT